MSTFKCKMCGGTLEIQNGSTVAECEYCGAKQTLPKLDDEKRANLYDRANHFRRSNEFDKASAIYEQILAEDSTDAEAYWSLVLCRYGIEYVEDPLSHRRVPTVNRAQYTSIFDDDNYKLALKNADSYQRIIYEEEAATINEIQKGILAISQKEEPFDVFICYKETDNNGRRTQDSVLAQELYYLLKQEGFKVFFARITLEDKLGSAYEPYIFAALNSAKIMVVLGTKPEHFNAVWVRNEWSRFLSLMNNNNKKTLIPAYKDMDPYNLPTEFSHLQAQDMSKLGFMQDLIRGIKKILGVDKKPVAPVTERVVSNKEGHDTAPLLRRAFLFLEDGDFAHADEYAEKVLDVNPECAEAYIVKLLVELKLNKPTDLARYKVPISRSLNYQKAIRFATPEYKATIEGYNSTIVKRLDTEQKEKWYSNGIALMRASKYGEAINSFQQISSYKDAAQKIEECKQGKETLRLEAIYNNAMHNLHASKYDEAIALFASISNYKDAKEKAEFCAVAKESARKERIYERAMRRVAIQLVISDAELKQSIEELQTISGYRDTDDQIRLLNARLEKWYETKRIAEEQARERAEAERRERERKAEIKRIKLEKAKKTTKTVVKISVPSIIALTVFFVLLFTLVIPLIRYNKADKLFNAGEYDAAMQVYGELNGFSKSEQRIAVLKGINQIDDASFEDGIKTILAAGVPVKLTCTTDGGDFTGKEHIQYEENEGSISLGTSAPTHLTPLATTEETPAPQEHAFHWSYESSDDFTGIKTPGKNGYRFVKWKLEAYHYQVNGTFELKLNAVWDDKHYSIGYDLAGGTFPEDETYYFGYRTESRTITLTKPIRTGYTFLGWTGTDLNKPTIEVTIPTGSYGTRKYVANWEANKYTITLDPNGGSVANTTITVAYDQQYTLPEPEWPGHTFFGWYVGNEKVTSGTWTTTSDMTLVAQWDLIEYNIEYVMNGGSNSPKNHKTYTVNDEITLVAPYKTGYTFLGWTYEGQSTPVLNVTIPAGTTGNKTYTANWKVNTYTITLVANGGTGCPATITTTYSKAYSLPTPTKTGYTFAGWYNGTEMYTGGTWIYTTNVALTAKWIANIYNVTLENTEYLSDKAVVTFDYNYSNATITTFTLTKGQLLEHPSIPQRTNYVFTGWYTDRTCTSRYSFTGTITGDMTLYAGWKSISTYNASAYNSDQIDPSKYTTGTTCMGMSTNGTSSRTKYYLFLVAEEAGKHSIYFRNSYYASHYAYYLEITNLTDGTTIRSNSTVSSTSYLSVSFDCSAGDVIMIAVYKSSSYQYDYSTASFFYEGFSAPTSSATADLAATASYQYAVDKSYSTTVAYGNNFTLPELTRIGYTFLGWYHGDTKVESGNWNIASNVTLTPKWELSRYTITLNANGGTVPTTSQTVTYGETYSLPTPTRTGYTFSGWYNGSTQYSGGTWTSLSDVTLTARWIAKEYTITYNDVEELKTSVKVTFNKNYSGSTSTTVTLVNGQVLSYPTAPTRSGYVFTGWYTSPACVTRYNFSYAITDDLTLYAGWQEMSALYAYTSTQINPTKYSSTTSAYSVSTSSTTSSKWKYIYLVAEETGTHYIYYKNSSSSSYEGCYLEIYNMTTAKTIRTSSVMHSTSYQSSNFSCSKGDIIVITLYRRNTSYSPTASFYFTGFTNPTSTSTASVSSVPGITYKEGSTYIDTVNYGTSYTLPTPTARTGYTFDGWYNGTTKVTNGAWSIADNVTLTPKWIPNTYTITLNADGGSVSSASKAVTYGSTYTLPTPTRTGYTFDGWYSGSTKYTGGTWTGTANITLQAKWTVNEYTITYVDVEEPKTSVTVTFDYNYSGSTSTTSTLNDCQTLAYPTVPTRSGYAFVGWYTDSACTTSYTFTETITEDITLYAKWVFMTNDSSYSREYVDIANYSSSSSQKWFSVSAPSSSIPDHYYFTCYKSGTYTLYVNFSQGDFYVTAYNMTQEATVLSKTNLDSGNSSKSASFAANAGDVICVSLYNSSGSTGYGAFYVTNASYPTSTATASLNSVAYKNGSTYVDTVNYGTNYTLLTPTRPGYTFTGWYNGNTKVENGAWNIASNVTLTARWASYSISYNMNGGTNAPDNPSMYSEYDSFTLAEPTRAGYTFLGWTYEGQDTPKKDVTIPVGSTGNKSFTANWQANTYTIIFDTAGGSVSQTSQTVTYGEAFTLPTPTREGYTFEGWYTTLGGSFYLTKVTDGTWTRTSNVTLKAKWTGNEYSITYQDTKYVPPYITVRFDYNYSGSTSTKSTLLSGMKLSYPTAPTRNGYIFTGWYTTSDCTTRYDFSGTITKSLTLYAGWMEMSSVNAALTAQIDPLQYTSSSTAGHISTSHSGSSSEKILLYLVAEETGTHVIYYANTSNSSDYGYYLQIENITTGAIIKSTSNVYSTNYEYTSFTCSAGDVILGSLYRANTNYSSDAYFYCSGFRAPRSTATASISSGYVYMAGTSSIDSVTYGSNHTLPTPTRAGYTFDGWYNGTTKVESGAWSLMNNATLTAKWTVNTYTVTFDANGGTVSPVAMTITYGNEYLLPTPTRTGYIFVGWYNGSTKYTDGIWTDTSNVTLTAEWRVDCAVDSTAHVFEDGYAIVEPTCTEPGIYRQNCQYCDHYELINVEALGHTYTYSWEIWDKVSDINGVSAEKCLTDNFKHLANEETIYIKIINGRVVEVEGKMVLAKVYGIDSTLDDMAFIEAYEMIISGRPLATHIVTEPTCTSMGYTTHTCSCGASFIDSYTEATGHTYIGYVCKECGSTSATPFGSKGFTISASNADGLMYVTGTVTSGRFDGSFDIADAAVFYTEDAGEGLYKLFFMNDTEKTYIVMADKAAGGALTTDATAATVFEWNTTYNTHEVAEDDNARAFGCNPTTTYMNLSCYMISTTDIYVWGQCTPVD